MIDVGSAIAYLDLDNSKFLNGINGSLASLRTLRDSTATIGDKMTALGTSFMKVGTGLSLGLTVPIVGAGVAFTKMASDAESSFAKVRTIIDESVVSYDNLKESVTQMSNETGIAITDFNEALYQSISASIDSGSAIQFTADMAKLAVGGFTELSQAVDVVTTIINAYGMSAEDATMISDRLITAQNLGKTTVDALSQSIGKIIPTANAFGVGLDDVTTGMALLTKNGIATAEATTYFNSMLNELGKSGTVASTALQELTGKTFSELISEGYNLADILLILQEDAANAGLTLMDMFGSAEAGKAAISLISGAGQDYADIMEQMVNSTGAAQKAFETIDDTPARRWEKAVNKLKNSGIELGYSLIPVMEKISEVISNVADTFNNLDENQKRTIVTVLKITAAIGPLVLAIGSVIKAIGAMNKALGAAAGPVGALLAIVSAVIALFTWLDNIPTKADAINESLKQSTEQTAEYAQALNDVSAKLNDFSDITDSFGMTQQDYVDQISAIQSSINSIYSTAIGERRELNQQDLDNLEEYYAKYEELRRRQIEQDTMFNDAQIEILQNRLETEDLTTEEIIGIENTLADLRNENKLKNDEYAASEIVTAQLKKESLIAAGTDELEAQQQYNDDLDDIYKERDERNKQYADSEKQTLNDVFDAHMQDIGWSLDISAQRGQIITDQQELMRKYGEEMKAIREDDSLNFLEKQYKDTQLTQAYLADLTTLTTEGKVLWEDYSYFQDENFQMQAASYWKYLDEKIEAGVALTDEDREIASNILGAYANLPSELQDQGKESLSSLLSGIENEELRAAIDSASSGTADNIINALSTEIGVKPVEIGKNVTRSVGDGMNGSGPFEYLANVARTVASNTLKVLKAGFGIHSPSREGKAIGSNVTNAIALGLLDALPDVKKSVNKIRDEVLTLNDLSVDDVSFNTSGNYKNNGYYGSQAKSNVNNVYNVSIESRPQTPLEITQELKSMEERIALGL